MHLLIEFTVTLNYGSPAACKVVCSLTCGLVFSEYSLPPTNEVWGKVMFYSCLSIILFRGGVVKGGRGEVRRCGERGCVRGVSRGCGRHPTWTQRQTPAPPTQR